VSDCQTIDGETFTQRCRRLLAEQPTQIEFTISRAGLEVLVLDSERYGELNAKLVCEKLAADEYYEQTRVRTLEEQVADVKVKYPGAELGDPIDEYGTRLLTVPGVKRSAKIWKNRLATVYLLVFSQFPSAHAQPLRFFTDEDDTLLEHGGQTFNVILATDSRVLGKWEWLWRIREPNWRHTLLQHVATAQTRFAFGSFEQWQAIQKSEAA
jgi:hypothetical protein